MVKLVGLVVLHLIASSGGTVTANNLREKLRIEAIGMVGHMAGEADGRKSGVPSYCGRAGNPCDSFRYAGREAFRMRSGFSSGRPGNAVLLDGSARKSDMALFTMDSGPAL